MIFISKYILKTLKEKHSLKRFLEDYNKYNSSNISFLDLLKKIEESGKENKTILTPKAVIGQKKYFNAWLSNEETYYFWLKIYNYYNMNEQTYFFLKDMNKRKNCLSFFQKLKKS